MKRRQFIRYTQAGLLAALGTSITSKWQISNAQTNETLTIQWLGHTCFLFSGGGFKVLVNPFRQIGCTAGYRDPKVETDIILISSRLLDEGEVEGFTGNPPPLLFFEPGAYRFNGIEVQGISTDKDREGGRRFGTNIAWSWKQAGIKILHLGSLASPIDIEQRILIGRPDVALLPVGGGPKAYTPQEAKDALKMLNPKIAIPTHYRTEAADAATCDIVALDEFLTLVDGIPVRNAGGDRITLSQTDLPNEGSVIEVLSYSFGNGVSAQNN